MVRACHYIETTHFMATAKGSLRGASLNSFKISDPLVIDAKIDLAPVGDHYAEFFFNFHHACKSSVALRLLVNGKFVNLSRML